MGKVNGLGYHILVRETVSNMFVNFRRKIRINVINRLVKLVMSKSEEKLKIICLGDSAVGKSKYVIKCLYILDTEILAVT